MRWEMCYYAQTNRKKIIIVHKRAVLLCTNKLYPQNHNTFMMNAQFFFFFDATRLGTI